MELNPESLTTIVFVAVALVFFVAKFGFHMDSLFGIPIEAGGVTNNDHDDFDGDDDF